MATNPVSPKVAAASAAAAIGVILAWLASLGGLDVPEAVEGAVVVLLTFGAGYVVRDPQRGVGELK